MRHYYRITNEELFNAVKDEITFGGVNVRYKEKGDQIYFEHKDIPARHLGTLYTLRIGTNEYHYSVLNYVRACLKSPKVSEIRTIALEMPPFEYTLKPLFSQKAWKKAP